MGSLRNSISQTPHLPHCEGVLGPGGSLQREIEIRRSCFAAQLGAGCPCGITSALLRRSWGFADPCPRSSPLSWWGRCLALPTPPQGQSCQCRSCGSNSRSYIPERDGVIQAHGSVWCLLSWFRREGSESPAAEWSTSKTFCFFSFPAFLSSADCC